MKFRKSYLLALAAPVALVALAAFIKHKNAGPPKPLPPLALLETHAKQIDGQTCSIVGGDAWIRDPDSKTWGYYMHLYDEDLFQKNYVVENNVTYRIDPGSGKRYAMSKHFKADFEDVATLNDLIGEKHGFTSFVLQSPSAPKVADYVKLRTGILNGSAQFIDNRVEPSNAQAHSGKQALRAHSVAPSWGMQCAKAHIESEMLHFVKGDDYWFSGWYYIAEGMPYTISDIKSGWIEGTPGLRLRLEAGIPQFEFKWADKPFYTQSATAPVAFPVKRWVHVVIHLKLSDEDDGLNELWLDGKQIIKATGRNLPLPDTIYNHVEVGISAALQDCTVFVDEVEVSDQPFSAIETQK